ncbi:MAG: hypothetical protein Q7J64_03405 [Elusimicrobiota bacterium]|nr:hypothetical protein [Elusimicrobiota bacterium]
MRKPSLPTRVIAATHAFALVHASFGTQAWAQVAPIGAVNSPVSGSGAAASGRFSSPSNSFTPSLSMPSAGLTPSFASSVAPAPSFAPAPTSVSLTPSISAALVPSALAAASKDPIPQSRVAPAAAKTEVASKLTLSSGLNSGRVATKAASIIAGVRALFGGKSVETVPAAPGAPVNEALVSGRLSAAHASDLEPSTERNNFLPQAGETSQEPPAPPSKPNEPAPKGKGWFGLGAIVAALIGGMLVMQLGLEAQGAAMAQLTEDSFGDFSILAQVAIFMSIGSMVGQQLAQFFSSRYGLTKTFYAAHTLRAVSLAAMVILLGTGHMALPLMFVFYAVNGVMTGVAATAEGTLRKFLLAQQGVSQQKFRTWWQLLAEIVAVPAPMVLGALVLSVGAGWITAIYPATIILGLMLFLMLKVLPWSAASRVENMVADAGRAAAATETPADPKAPKIGSWQKIKNAFKQIFSNMEEGKDFVMKNAVLKYALGGAVIFDLMNSIIYRLIAPGYGKLVAGSGGMAAVQGNLLGMFSLGGLLLAATFLILERIAKKKNAGKSAEELAAAERSSMLRWTLLGIPALGLLGVMAFNLVLPFAPLMFMDVNWIPGTVLAAALIPFGFMQVAASIKLNSYFQDRLPSDSAKVQKAIAFSGSALTALSIVMMLALKPLFGDIAAFNPFPYLAGALIPLGATVFFIWRKLTNATKPENIKLAPDAAEEKTAGGFVGVLLGVIAAALLLSFMPFIPGAAGLLAGLGVLGKFALHLGVALAVPMAGWFADRAIRRRSKGAALPPKS